MATQVVHERIELRCWMHVVTSVLLAGVKSPITADIECKDVERIESKVIVIVESRKCESKNVEEVYVVFFACIMSSIAMRYANILNTRHAGGLGNCMLEEAVDDYFCTGV